MTAHENTANGALADDERATMNEIRRLERTIREIQARHKRELAPVVAQLGELQRQRAAKDAEKIGLRVGQHRRVTKQARAIMPVMLDRWHEFTVIAVSYGEDRSGEETLFATIADDMPGVSTFFADVIAMCEIIDRAQAAPVRAESEGAG